MIKEAIEKIVAMAAPNKIEAEWGTYTDKQLTLLKKPLPDAFRVQTLGGFIDLVKAPIDDATKETFIVHVVSPVLVALRQRVSSQGERVRLLEAHYQPPDFKFGQFLQAEHFIIGLQAMFRDTEDLRYAVELASGLRDEKVGISQDDGISQTVTVRAGVALRENTSVKRKITLAPIRTFTEVIQPTSEFVLRMRSSNAGEQPLIALFEADGGAWQKEAIDNIGEYLKGHLAEGTIIVS